MKAYYEKNRVALLEKQRIRNKANYQANKDRYRAKSKRWKETNPERFKELQQASQERNREAINARSRDWYLANKVRAQVQTRARKIKGYGLTPEEYLAMLEAQDWKCAICGTDKPSSREGDSFHIDHCHSTGKVRGLLCMKCNTGLGMFSDNTDMLRAAMDYLTRSLSGATSTKNNGP